MSDRKGFLLPEQEEFYSELIIAALKTKGIVNPAIKLGVKLGDNMGLERLKERIPDATEEQIILYIDEFTNMLMEIIDANE